MPLTFTDNPVPLTQALEVTGANTNSCILAFSQGLYYFTIPTVGQGPPGWTNPFLISKSVDNGATWTNIAPTAPTFAAGARGLVVMKTADGSKARIIAHVFRDATNKAYVLTFDPAVDDFISESVPGPDNLEVTCAVVNSDETILTVVLDTSVVNGGLQAMIYDPVGGAWGAPVTVVASDAIAYALQKEKGTDRSYLWYQGGASTVVPHVICNTITYPALTLGVAQDLALTMGQIAGNLMTVGLPCIRGADTEVLIPVFTEDTGAFPTDITKALVNVLRSPCGVNVAFTLTQVDSYLNFTPPAFPANFVGAPNFFASVVEYLGDLYVFYAQSSTTVASDPTDGILFYAVQTGGAGAWATQNLVRDGTPLAVAQVYPVLITANALGLFAVFLDPTTYFDDFDQELKYTSLSARFLLNGSPALPLSIVCGSPPSGTVGTPYSHAFPASGGTPPYTFSISAGSLPVGLSIDPATGVVSGSPTTAGTFNFTVTVTGGA